MNFKYIYWKSFKIESIQIKIKESLIKLLNIDSSEQLNDLINTKDFQEYFEKFEGSKCNTEYYNQLKLELTRAEKKDNYTETSELSKILKTLYAEHFFTK